jgi:hypothetical protein
MAVSTGVAARLQIGNLLACWARFNDQSTVEKIINPDAICGSRLMAGHRVQSGRRMIQFTTVHDLTAPLMNVLLPLIGSTLAAGVHTANEIVTPVDILVDKVGAIHQYTNCRVVKAILRGQVGTLPCQIETTWLGEDEIEPVSPVFSTPTTDGVIAFSGATLKVAAVSTLFDRFAWVVDNQLVPSWNASPTVTDVGPGPQQVLAAFSVPYITGNKSQYWAYKASNLDAAIEIVLTNGLDSVKIELPTAKLIPESPSIESAGAEIRLPETWMATTGTSTPGWKVTVTNTP